MNQSQCKELFEYRDGGLYWKQDRGSNAKSGHRAGRTLKTGYRSIHVCGRRYQEHRLVYLWHNGYLPSQLDHSNRIKTDNRIENLRPATPSENQVNTPDRLNSSGYRGVRFIDKTGKWAARIYMQGKEIRVGTFDTAIQASDAYEIAAKEAYGDFAK